MGQNRLLLNLSVVALAAMTILDCSRWEIGFQSMLEHVLVTALRDFSAHKIRVLTARILKPDLSLRGVNSIRQQLQGTLTAFPPNVRTDLRQFDHGLRARVNSIHTLSKHIDLSVSS